MRFRDRADGGQRLAKKLLTYKNNPKAIVLGLPRGGVVTAYEVAKELSLPLDIIVTRKIGAPGQEELAVGALTQEGKPIFNQELLESLGLSEQDVAAIIEKEKKEAQRLLATYRGNRAPLDVKNKIAIIVDDGIATGATMRAAVATARNLGALKIIVAVPVAPPESLKEIRKEADEVICLFIPEVMLGVGAFYDLFAQTDDATVIELLRKVIK